MPQPTDGGKTYTFKIRDGVKFHDGSPLTAADVAKSWQMIIDPPKGVLSVAPKLVRHGRQGRGSRPDDRRLPAEVRDRCVHTGARRPLHLHLQKGDPRQGSAVVREKRPGLGPVQICRIRNRPGDQRGTQPRLLPEGIALSRRLYCASMPKSRRSGSTRSAAAARRWNSADCRPRRATSSSKRSATRLWCRRATGIAAVWCSPTTRKSRSTMPGCGAH